jgi:hypothetical protein
VTGDLDHIFGSVGSWRGEVCHDDLIHVLQLRERHSPWPPLEIIGKFQDFRSNRARIGAGESNDADSPTAWRRRNGNNRVFKVHWKPNDRSLWSRLGRSLVVRRLAAPRPQGAILVIAAARDRVHRRPDPEALRDDP